MSTNTVTMQQQQQQQQKQDERRQKLEKREKWVREQEDALKRDEENLRQFREHHELMRQIALQTAADEAKLKEDIESFEREKGPQLRQALQKQKVDAPQLSMGHYTKLMSNTTDYGWWKAGQRDVTSTESPDACFLAIRDDRGLVVEHWVKKSVLSQ